MACAFIEISMFHAIMERDERKFFISILPDTKLSTGQRALLQYAFDLVNLQGFAARCP